ncbi:MAG: hypothetical protein DCC68_19065 [Planctomycetota bacterium]|nr:MAG: hypothetical protein DCC68_19065 [Planctomycetota bacterium]
MTTFFQRTAVRLVLSFALSVWSAAAIRATPVVERTDSFTAPGNAVQMEYAPDYGLLFLRNSGSAVHVVDVATRQRIDLRLATETFTDFDLTGDQRYLYAADYGGTRTGYGDPIRPSLVQRFDLQTRTWETRTAPWVVFRIEGVNAERYLVQEIDQHVDMMLNSWEATQSRELSRIRADYYGDFEYDDRLGRIYHGSSGSSSSEIHVRRLVGDVLVSAGDTGTYGTADSGGGSSVLSTDGERFYYGRLQVEALDVRNNLRFFPEIIRAATGDIAFGNAAYYDAHTGEELGTYGFQASAITVSDDGREMWAFDQSTNQLHRYRIHTVPVPEPTSAAILVAAMACASVCRFVGRRTHETAN